MFILPQRFQLVYGTSGLDAGVRLIPFTAVIPIGSIFASIMCGKIKIPPVYLLLVGSALQVLGFALIGTLPSTLSIPSRIYGFQILAGWGCGINFSLLFILIPFITEKRDSGMLLSTHIILSPANCKLRAFSCRSGSGLPVQIHGWCDGSSHLNFCFQHLRSSAPSIGTWHFRCGCAPPDFIHSTGGFKAERSPHTCCGIQPSNYCFGGVSGVTSARYFTNVA